MSSTEHPSSTDRSIERRWIQLALTLTCVIGTVFLNGCIISRPMARQMVRAPNTFPEVYSPDARVYLTFGQEVIDQFPAQSLTLETAPDVVRLNYRIVEAGNHGFQPSLTNLVVRGKSLPLFKFTSNIPAIPNAFTANPKGTLFLLHGYGLTLDTVVPWGLLMADAGWRCVLVDLRGHGDSVSRRIGFGSFESRDLSRLLDHIEGNHVSESGAFSERIAVLGISYGAAIALRWLAEEPRLHTAVAITPYADLVDAIVNVRDSYASWVPRFLIRYAAREVPHVLGVPPEELNPEYWIARQPHPVLGVAAHRDVIAPPEVVEDLIRKEPEGSRFLLLPDFEHEDLPFQFDALGPYLIDWFDTH